MECPQVLRSGSGQSAPGCMGVQVVLRHGQLRMYSNREVVCSGWDGRCIFIGD